MAVWTLTYAGTTKTFAQWGLEALKRTQASQAVGAVTFTQSGASFDGTPLFAIDAVVTISKDGAPWHVGPVIMVPRAAGARSERLEYQIADPWWYLEQLIYEQTIAVGSGEGSTSRISLFGSVVGGVTLKQSVATVIAEAVGLAVSAGASMQLSFSGSFGISPPMVDMRDPTCAEIIRAALRWVPDATIGIDYSTTPPTLCFATRAGATAREIDLADHASVNLIAITPRDDLRRECVIIRYETTSTDDGETYTSYSYDTAGSGSPFRTLKATLPLSGAQTQRQYQYIETELISEESETWWKRHVSALNDASDLELTDGESEPADEDGDSYSRAIIDGQVPGWLDDPDSPISGNMRVSVKASYTLEGDDGAEIKYQDDPVSVVIAATDLTTGTYSVVTSATDAEPVPSGIAASLYYALSQLMYDGKIRIKQRECSFITRPGEVLNLIHGASAWATARMQVQRVEEDVDGGETTITFGPPKHLSPQDIIEMLRTMRGKPPVYNLEERQSGKKGADNTTAGGQTTANENGAAAGAAWHRVVAKGTEGDTTMTLDADEGIKLEDGEGGSIDMQIPFLRTVHTDDEGNSASIEPGRITVLDGDGNGVEITPTGLSISKDGNTTELTLLQLLHTNVDGKTNSITDEQMVISDSGKLGVYESTSVALSEDDKEANLDVDDGLEITDGDNTATLDTTKMQILIDEDSVTVSPEGGLSAVADGLTAEISPAGGVHLEDTDGGTVDIVTKPGKQIAMKNTQMCEEDGEGEITPGHAYALRSDVEADPP